jgi:hypothetical protein
MAKKIIALENIERNATEAIGALPYIVGAQK